MAFDPGFDAKSAEGWFRQHMPTDGSTTLVDFVYGHAKGLYVDGAFRAAATALLCYVGLDGRKVEGIHLLGHALYHCKRFAEAVPHLQRSVKEEQYQADWQLLVESYVAAGLR